MAHDPTGPTFRHLQRLLEASSQAELSDGRLLERFAARHDPAAFETLLRRHGPMVLAACRAILNDVHDAEDAFQATFLVLARQAATVRQRESLAAWLYGVAQRVARKALARAARRRACEREARPMLPQESDADAAEIRSLLHEELGRLPERLRAPLVLCYLQGRSNDEAAQALQCPVGTIKSRLSHARERLRQRLARRGVVMAGAAMAACLSEQLSPAAVPGVLVKDTLVAAVNFTAGTSLSPPLAYLAESVLSDLGLARLKQALLGVLLFVVLGLGAGAAAWGILPHPPEAEPEVAGNAPPPAPVRGAAEDADVRITVPPGFRAERAVRRPDADGPFSLINLTFDARGRLLVAQENGPVLLCTGANAAGVCEVVRPYCEQVRNCQGMCWIGDALLLVGEGPDGAGLYRCRDTTGADRINEVTALLRFGGPMSEHGPHAVLRGPDGCVYLVLGHRAGLPGQPAALPAAGELLPALTDPRGHAADLHAPGGSLWRLDRDGRNPVRVSAGYYNPFDAACNSAGELFTFDSDMEWDAGLPWYRPVRLLHAAPGSDFGCRAGSANTPADVIDGLPATLEVGRGAPVGLEFYEHETFPEKYRGSCFLADWSQGLIYAARLRRDGASYRAEMERFCSGAPLNVTDLAVGPDGGLYFTAGGRGSRGGVYRVVYREAGEIRAAVPAKRAPASAVEAAQRLVAQPQPLAAWSQTAVDRLWTISPGGPAALTAELVRLAQSADIPARQRVRALNALHDRSLLSRDVLAKLADDRDASVRSQVMYLLGARGIPADGDLLRRALADADSLVRRRACEALVRAGCDVSADAIWPLLGGKDRFLRTAARRVLQRIDPQTWARRLEREPDDAVAWEATVALYEAGQAKPWFQVIFARLARPFPFGSAQTRLDYLRTVELALVRGDAPVSECKDIARRCVELFPTGEPRVDRELATLLTFFRREHLTNAAVHTRLLAALRTEPEDRPQQVLYFACLRLLREDWTSEQKDQLLTWFDAARERHGASTTGSYLDAALADADGWFTAEDRGRWLSRADRFPRAATALLRQAPRDQLPPAAELAAAFDRSSAADDLQLTLIVALGRRGERDDQAALRRIGDRTFGRRDAVAQALARTPSAENWPYLVAGLRSSDRQVLTEVVEALRRTPRRPEPGDAAPYRDLLRAAARLDGTARAPAVALLRQWATLDGDNLEAWARWYAQTFPQGPPLAETEGERPAARRSSELAVYLEKGTGGHGDPERGRVVFQKAQCARCHRHGAEGGGIGPDLTTVARRFKRSDILESILQPSKVISDQYRPMTLETSDGTFVTGLVAAQGDTLAVTQSNGNKLVLKKEQVVSSTAATVSIMPEKLLDPLSREEIADLFAFLEASPP